MVYVNKFYTFTASALIQAAGAPVYTFSIYASALSSSLGLDQVQLEGVGSMLSVGNFLALLSGSAYDALEHHSRMGPRLTIWVGCVLGALGYGGLYLAASGMLDVSYAQLMGLAFIAGNASSWFDTATIVTNVKNFPNNRGAVVGLLKSFVGLSGSIYSSLYSSSLSPDASAYLRLLAWCVCLLPLALSLGVNHVPYVERAELHSLTSWFNPESRFLLSYVTVAALALYQMTSALLEGLGGLPVTGSSSMDLLDLNTAGMFGLLGVMLLVPWRSGGITSRYVHDHLANLEEEDGTLPKWTRQLHSAASTTQEEAASLLPARASSSAPALGSAAAAAAAAAAPSASCAPAAAAPAGSSSSAEGASGGAADRAVDIVVSLREPLLHKHEQQQQPQEQQEQQEQQQEQQQQQQDDDVITGHQEQLERQTVQSGTSLLSTSSLHAPAAAPAAPSITTIECRHHFTNLSLLQAAATLQFWLLFGLFVAGVGACLTFLNNLGQLVIALGGAAGGQVVFVSIFAVGNAAGRLLMGVIPEHYLHSTGTPRTKWLLGTFAILTAAVLSTAAATSTSHLYLLSLALGLCYGATFTLIPAIAADLFGLRHFAANYAALQTACAIACYVFPTQLAGSFYRKAVAEHGTGEPCIGTDCYGPTFVVEGVVCVLGCVFAGVVLVSTRGVYEQLSQHLIEVDEEEQQDMIEQWHAEHANHLLHVVRAPSDPTISATTGVPAGQYGQSFHRMRGHSNAAVTRLHSGLLERQQQQQQQQGLSRVSYPSAGQLSPRGQEGQGGTGLRQHSH